MIVQMRHIVTVADSSTFLDGHYVMGFKKTGQFDLFPTTGLLVLRAGEYHTPIHFDIITGLVSTLNSIDI